MEILDIEVYPNERAYVVRAAINRLQNIFEKKWTTRKNGELILVTRIA